MVAVEPDSGAMLWSFDSGAPLLSVMQSEASPPGVHIFPGVDGGLYAYQGLDSDTAKLEVRCAWGAASAAWGGCCMGSAWSLHVSATVSTLCTLSMPSPSLTVPPVSSSLTAPTPLLHSTTQRLPITLPELVEASPSLTDDDSVIIGNRKSSVFMLDVTTGRLVQALSGSLEDRAAEGGCTVTGSGRLSALSTLTVSS